MNGSTSRKVIAGVAVAGVGVAAALLIGTTTSATTSVVTGSFVEDPAAVAEVAEPAPAPSPTKSKKAKPSKTQSNPAPVYNYDPPSTYQPPKASNNDYSGNDFIEGTPKTVRGK